MRTIAAATVWADNTPGDYLPLFLLLGLAVLLGATQLIASHVLGKRGVPSPAKDSPYECGIEAETSAHTRFSVKFYLVAVLFILFDVESLLLIPWAVTAREFAAAGVGGIVFAEIVGFVAVLGVGLAFVWRKGGLSWDR